MTSRWRRLAAGVLLGAHASPLPSQQARELGVQAVATASDPLLAVLGGYAALRFSERVRASAAIGAGVSDGRGAWRGELLGHFLLSPHRERGVGFYVASGVAAVGGPVDRGYIVLSVGMEQRPGSGSGWALEAGVGGGARVLLGYRWRWFAVGG